MHNALKLKPIAAVLAACALPGVHHAVAAPVLEEVIVTAQKREEGLQDVPISMQVVSGDSLLQNNIFRFDDLVDRLPNVNLGLSPGAPAVTMRGIGTGAANPAAEQAVSMYIDGVYLSRAYQFASPFLDIERVEVLKGPQGVLQGKNSVAGAVVITTRRPTEETDAYLRTSYEVENDGYSVEGAVSGALAGNLFARLTAQHNEEGGWLATNSRLAADGVTMLDGNDNQNELEFSVVRLGTLWQATDEVDLFLKLETGETERKGIWYGGYAIQPGAIVGGPNNNQTPIIDDYTNRDPNYGFITDGVISNGFRNTYDAAQNQFQPTNKDHYLRISSESATAQLDWDAGALGTLTAISGYSQYDHGQYVSNTMAPIDWLTFQFADGDGGEEFDQFSQEIRLASPGGATVDYIVGAFFMDRNLRQDGANGYFNFSNGLGAPAEFDFIPYRDFKEHTRAWSVFTQLTWNVSDALRFNAGARYSDESKDLQEFSFQAEFLVPSPLNQLALDNFGVVPFTTADVPQRNISDTNLDPNFSLQWDATDELMLYASYTRATKAGGFNASATSPDNTNFDPEDAEGLEAGLKGTFIDSRLMVNLALFHTEYDDLQVSALDSATNSFFFKNAARATSEGVEAELRFAALESLEVGSAIAYLHARYDDFPGASCSVGLSREADCDPATDTRNAKGDAMRFAPDWSATLYASYHYTFASGWEAGLRGELLYSDKYYIAIQNDPYLQQDAFTKYDATATLTSPEGNWIFSLVGKNLADKTTVSFGEGTPLRNGAYWSNVDAPRLVYLNLQYNF